MTTLYIDTTARFQNIATSDLASRILVEKGEPVIYRPISEMHAIYAEQWPDAHFADQSDRSSLQHTIVETCETFGAEFFAANHLVFNLPLSGGRVPAAFKAWVDLIAYSDFEIEESFAQGFKKKSATLVVAVGGLKAGSESDNLTPYLINLLNFIGITDIEIVAADTPTPPTSNINSSFPPAAAIAA